MHQISNYLYTNTRKQIKIKKMKQRKSDFIPNKWKTGKKITELLHYLRIIFIKTSKSLTQLGSKKSKSPKHLIRKLIIRRSNYFPIFIYKIFFENWHKSNSQLLKYT